MTHPTLLWSRPYHSGLRHLHEGDHAAAERELTEAVRVAERLAEPDDRLGCSLAALAELCRAERRYPEAARLYRRALAVEERALGPAHPYTRQVEASYAELRRELAGPRATRCAVGRRAARAAGQRRAQRSHPRPPTPGVETHRAGSRGGRSQGIT
jgi:tetratricopeptide (TPR) repeat protein